MTDNNPAADLTASARPAAVPLDRTIKALLSVIAVALTLIALRPFMAPAAAQAQNPGTAEGSGTFIAISEGKDREPTALVGYKNLQGQAMVSALVLRAGKWQLLNGINLPN